MKKILKSALAALAFAGASVIAPSMASAADTACLLNSGCFYTSGDGGGYWVCSDPMIFMLCLEP